MKAIVILCTLTIVMTQFFVANQITTELRAIRAKFESSHMGFEPAPLERIIRDAVK